MASDTSRLEGVCISANPRPPLTATASELKKMLLVITEKIVPLTKTGVASGSKMFGAAILNKDLELLHADTNEESACPLFHGEVKCIYAWSKSMESAAVRQQTARNSIFLSTHEPCCMCISSILWSGFPKVFYLFSYRNTADQGIPYDIDTMHELWGVNSYRRTNKYLSTACIQDLIEALPVSDAKTELQGMFTQLVETYDGISSAQDTTSAVPL